MIAALAPAIFLGICEIAAALCGVRVPRYHAQGAETDYWIPYEAPGAPAGLQRVVAREFKTFPEKLPLFVKNKPANGFRVFTLGESSVQGSPYEIGSFSDWLRLRLTAMMPDRAVEVVNAGNAGWHATEIHLLLQECLRYEPDLFVWMVGHNEFAAQNLVNTARYVHSPVLSRIQDFARSLRTTQVLSRYVPGIVQSKRITLIDRNAGDGRRCVDDGELQFIQNQFKKETRAAIRDAQEANVSIVVCSMPRSMKCTPSGSYFSENLFNYPEQRVAWNNLYKQGDDLLKRRDARAAIVKLEEALKIDDRPAKLRFALGKAYETLGQAERARAEYLQSLELDACPNRAVSWIQQIIRETAAEYQVPLTDLELAFDRVGALGIAGDELIYDNVHPTLPGHERIAEELLLTFERELKLPLDRTRDVKGPAGRKALGTDLYQAKTAKRNECLMNLKLVLLSGEVNDQWQRTRDAARDVLANDATDMEMLGAAGLLEVMKGEIASGKSMIERAMHSNAYIKTQYVFYYKMEPPYRRIFDKAAIDMAAEENSLDDAQRKVLSNRIAREKTK